MTKRGKAALALLACTVAVAEVAARLHDRLRDRVVAWVVTADTVAGLPVELSGLAIGNRGPDDVRLESFTYDWQGASHVVSVEQVVHAGAQTNLDTFIGSIPPESEPGRHPISFHDFRLSRADGSTSRWLPTLGALQVGVQIVAGPGPDDGYRPLELAALTCGSVPDLPVRREKSPEEWTAAEVDALRGTLKASSACLAYAEQASLADSISIPWLEPVSYEPVRAGRRVDVVRWLTVAGLVEEASGRNAAAFRRFGEAAILGLRLISGSSDSHSGDWTLAAAFQHRAIQRWTHLADASDDWTRAGDPWALIASARGAVAALGDFQAQEAAGLDRWISWPFRGADYDPWISLRFPTMERAWLRELMLTNQATADRQVMKQLDETRSLLDRLEASLRHPVPVT